MRAETEIKNRHLEIASVSARHRLIERMTDIDDHGAQTDEHVLDGHREKQIVFDQQHRDAAQRMIVVCRMKHRLSHRG